MKKIVGLTGTCCAGKNFVASILEEQGLPVLDLDKLGHQVIETEKERILGCLGEDILAANGLIDRKRLGEKVFGKPEKLSALEEIIHPAVNRETMSWISGRNEKACVINAALLHRSSAFEVMDAIILVEAPLIVRLLRAKKRDNLPWPALIKRFRSQRGFHSQYCKKKTDIYRVGNPSGCVNFGHFGFGKRRSCQARTDRTAIENRIKEILSLLGIM